VIYIRDECGPVRTGINVYPRKSGSFGFIVALGRFRLMLRYSWVWGTLDFSGWRNER
jgi:hypothetical protein